MSLYLGMTIITSGTGVPTVGTDQPPSRGGGGGGGVRCWGRGVRSMRRAGRPSAFGHRDISIDAWLLAFSRYHFVFDPAFLLVTRQSFFTTEVV